MRCKAQLKPADRYKPHRCPEKALPGSNFCPLHTVIARRLKERHDAWLSLPERLEKLPKEEGEL
ncbi:hypothetical protein LCGC14_1665970 [marine sediment metagenome]|uniref:Uncharacterized protein n=1 Tax=marine sediment metagenome TaxID=412755 RepID=A0A0F9K8I4_9ZZZZ